jgi:CheY-like chemotaxis protein
MPGILIVDDDPMIASMLADWLGELGHDTVGPTHDTASALALIEMSPPDAAIVDVSLGSESGYPVAECLDKRKIPFVFATGHTEASLIPRFKGTRVLLKPFDFAAVREAIGEMMAPQQ